MVTIIISRFLPCGLIVVIVLFVCTLRTWIWYEDTNVQYTHPGGRCFAVRATDGPQHMVGLCTPSWLYSTCLSTKGMALQSLACCKQTQTNIRNTL